MVREMGRRAELEAQRWDSRGNPQQFAAKSFLRQLVWGCSLKRKASSACVAHIDADRFLGEIVVGTVNNLRLCTAPPRCGLSGRPRR
jgi:hypothetical protein